MAGTCEFSSSVRKFGDVIVERILKYVFTADATGSVPKYALGGYENYVIDQIITEPDATNVPNEYRVSIEDVDDWPIFLGLERSTTDKEYQGGYEYTGKVPSIDSDFSVRLVDPDGTTDANLGNVKKTTVWLRLKRKYVS